VEAQAPLIHGTGYTYFMGIGVAFLLLVCDQYDVIASKVRFPDGETQRQASKPSEAHRKVVNLITERTNWARAFRTIHERLGILPTDVDIQVLLEETDETRPASGAGKDGHGTVRFNMKLLGPFQQRLDEYDLQRMSGKRIKLLVPPSRLDTIVTHELTHIVCGAFEDAWLTEGLASYAAGEDVLMHDFNHRGAKVEALDHKLDRTDAYARGLSFFRWMEKEFGSEKVRAFAGRVARVRDGKPAPVAAEVLGLSWDQLLPREKAWSAEYIATFKNSP